MFEQFASGAIQADIEPLEHGLLQTLLFDRSTRKNVIWATDDYTIHGDTYSAQSEIGLGILTDGQSELIRPRTAKGPDEQQSRIREKAEVFTPSWICNQQNNLIDEAWFGCKEVFNTTDGQTWSPTQGKILFPEKGAHTWQRYIDAKRLEITCGEAPYLVSRFDVTTGEPLPLKMRIGLLDRKLRVVCENNAAKDTWLTWAIRAVQSIYGYEFQGDSLLLARLNVFFTFLDYYEYRFHELPPQAVLNQVARIVSWNLWQMDGRKYVAPYSCKPLTHEENTLFGPVRIMEPCPGCKNNRPEKHTGVYCKIMDWRAKRSFRYIDLLKGVKTYGGV